MTSNIVETHSQIAKNYYEDGKLEEALEACQKAIEVKQDLDTAYQVMGSVFKSQGKINEAAQAWYDLGNLCVKKENYERAVLLYNRAIKLNPKHCRAYYQLGDTLKKQAKPNEAIDAYLEAIKIDPSFSEPYYRLKYASIDESKLEEVIQVCRQATQANPDFPFAYVLLGDMLTQQDKFDDAISCYQTAIYKQTLAAKPNYIKYHWDFGKVTGPKFLIIGFGKCGTTSLYAYLNNHPRVLRAVDKELHFFNNHFECGLEWYKAHFPPIPENKDFMTGEATPWYINWGGVEQKVFQAFPEVQLLVVLRNPVARAVSHFYHNRKVGIEHRSFEEAMLSEIEKLQGITDPAQVDKSYWKTEQGYLFVGFYLHFIKKWMSLFPKEQFLIIDNDDLSTEPVATMNQVFEFLGLPEHKLPIYQKHNSGSYSPIDQEMYGQISNIFKTHNQKLEEYLARSFDWE